MDRILSSTSSFGSSVSSNSGNFMSTNEINNLRYNCNYTNQEQDIQPVYKPDFVKYLEGKWTFLCNKT